MSGPSPVRCITCQHFTLKPRAGEDEFLRQSDRDHARVGMGRCQKDELTRRWHPAESERQCDKHAAISEAQAAARRDWIRSKA